MIGTNDMRKARDFYKGTMPLLGASLYEAWSTDERICYASSPTAPMLSITRPHDGHDASVGNGTMIAFAAPSREVVEAVHAAALALGGAGEGSAGYRSSDPGDLYRAYFRDLDGNKMMVFERP
jgi:predicted lactoylglutathione lyase